MKKIIYVIFCMLILLVFQGTVSFGLEQTTQNTSSTSNQGEIIDLSFYQLNFNLDGVETHNSDWGVAEVSFVGSDEILYLNLNAYETWAIQNVPVLSVMGDDVDQIQRFWFPLPVETGEDIEWILYGISLTENIIEAPPEPAEEGIVNDDGYIVFNGARDFEMNTEITGAAIVRGGIVQDEPEQHRNLNFPNQQAGPGECAPTAVSNSLQFLNKTHNMGLNASNLTIAKMKEACNWGPLPSPGCWIFHNDSRPAGERNAWYEDKNESMADLDINVSTRRFNKTEIGNISDEIDDDQDIEMELGGHTVSVVGIAELENGNFSVTVAHDKNQSNNNAGTVVETGVWNATNGWSGALAPYGNNLNYFIVECPKEREEEPNRPPNAPARPSGATSGSPGTAYTYSSSAIDPDGDKVSLLFSWGDGTDSGWEGPYDSEEVVEMEKTWNEKGDYQVKVKARDIPSFEESDWSEPLSVSMPKNKAINTMPLPLRFLDNYPLIYQLIQRLLKL